MGVTSIFRMKANIPDGKISVDMSGWDYMVFQNYNIVVSNVEITNDGGAIEGSVDDSAITVPVIAPLAIQTFQILDLNSGNNVASYPLAEGIYKIENIARYVIFTLNNNDAELIIMLYKKG